MWGRGTSAMSPKPSEITGEKRQWGPSQQRIRGKEKSQQLCWGLVSQEKELRTGTAHRLADGAHIHPTPTPTAPLPAPPSTFLKAWCLQAAEWTGRKEEGAASSEINGLFGWGPWKTICVMSFNSPGRFQGGGRAHCTSGRWGEMSSASEG